MPYLPFVIYCWSLLTPMFKLIRQSNLTTMVDLLVACKNMNHGVPQYVYSSKSFIFLLKKHTYVSSNYINCLCDSTF